MKEVFKAFNLLGVVAVQVAYDVIRVTFSTNDGFRQAKELSGVRLFGLWCPILGGGPPVTIVHVFEYPFEEDNAHVSSVFEDFGEVKKVKNQTYLSNSNIFTGTRLVFMVLNSTLPRQLTINGYLCRVWYKGQPLVCNLCNVQGHKAAVCPNKDRCRRCGESGHFARSCTKDLDPSPVSRDEDRFLPSTSSGADADRPLNPNALSAERSNLVRLQNEAIDQNDRQNDRRNDNAGPHDSDANLVQVTEDLEDVMIVRIDKLPNIVVDEGQNDDVVQISEDQNEGTDTEGQNDDVGQNEGTETVESCESENNIVSESNEGTDSNAITTDVVLGHEDPPVASASAEAGGDSQDSLMEFSESPPSQSSLPAEGGTVSAETGGSQDSISEFSESSPSQSILGPKNGLSVGYGSRNLQGKVKSSVISKLLPRKQPVVRTGHHAVPAVIPSRPASGVKTKKR